MDNSKELLVTMLIMVDCLAVDVSNTSVGDGVVVSGMRAVPDDELDISSMAVFDGPMVDTGVD